MRIVPRYGERWVRILTDIPAGIQSIRAGRMSPLQYLRSLARATVFSVFDPHDPLPAVGDLMVAAGRLTRAISRRQPARGSVVGGEAAPATRSLSSL